MVNAEITGERYMGVCFHTNTKDEEFETSGHNGAHDEFKGAWAALAEAGLGRASLGELTGLMNAVTKASEKRLATNEGLPSEKQRRHDSVDQVEVKMLAMVFGKRKKGR
jgi:hypothetical protein